MNTYKNLGGDSGIIGYDYSSDSITVFFNTGAVYLYNVWSTGRANINHMINLAKEGHGLNSFISREVRKRYAKRVR